MDMGHLYTSVDGRINRAKYWLGAIVLGIILLLVTYGSIYAAGGSVLEQDSRTRMITLTLTRISKPSRLITASGLNHWVR